MRRPLISGNWKMNLNHFEAIQTVQKLHYLIPREAYRTVDVSVHPSFTDIRSVQTVIEADDLDLLLGAQHCHWDVKGAFTGEVSPLFLAKLDVELVVCGHSERRELFGETNEMVARKVVFPSPSRASVLSLTSLGRLDISAFPPALSAIGPKASVASVIPKVESIPAQRSQRKNRCP